MARVVVLGSLHMDVLVYAPDRPRKGETLAGTRWALRAGGKGGNQAVQAAHQGSEVYMVGRVGHDDFGEELLTALEQAGVNTRHIRLDDAAGSGMSVAIVDQQGDYGAIIVSGVNLHIDETDVEQASATLAQADCLVLQYEVPLTTVQAAAEFAHRHGVRVILNAAPAYPTPPGLFNSVDVLVVNEIEAEMITGQPVTNLDEAQHAARLLRAQGPTVLVTLGASGVIVASSEDDLTHLPGYRVDLVDTHGAGDAFIGALATRIALGDALLDAARYANVAGALMVTHAGPQANITPDQVQAFLTEWHTSR